MKHLSAVILALIACQAAGHQGEQEDLWRIFSQKTGSYAQETRHIDEKKRPRFVNALIRESSPYLLQHAHNPISWKAWGNSTLASARKTNQLIFLSIGYSTCHWCRVMARDSFDSERIAGVLNEHYVSIKVDREEHPAIDAFFLARLELLSNSPGWPMTLILTPDGDLVAAESYMPEESLLSLITRVATTWRERPQNIRQLAASIASKFPKLPPAPPSASDHSARYADALTTIRQQYDEIHHGFGRTPKFPNAPQLLSLLDASRRLAAPDDREKFLSSLRTMAQSALHDPIDGGFFRYSVSQDWQTPHFEKTLYDQATLAQLFAEAWAISDDPLFFRASKKTLAFANERLQRSDGLFYSALDAESEGREGAYYLWREADLTTSLSANERALVTKFFHLVKQGERGVLLQPQAEAGGPVFEAILARLGTLRKQRRAPAVDTKVISGWNAMMIESMARCGELLGDIRYLRQAGQAMTRLLSKHADGSQLARYSMDQETHGQASLEDVAHLLSALAALYEIDGNSDWHTRARQLLPAIIGTSLVDAEHLRLFARDRELPAATAVLMRALHTLFLQSRELRFRQALEAIRPLAASILAADGVDQHAVLATALYEIEQPSPQRKAFLARGHVHAELAVQKPSAPSGKTAFTLRLRMDPGWHINSHEPLQDYLVPLRVESTMTPPHELSVSYPIGKTLRLPFADGTLSVHEGTVAIEGKIDAKPTANSAPHSSLKLSLQACSETSCLPPESVLLRLLAP